MFSLPQPPTSFAPTSPSIPVASTSTSNLALSNTQQPGQSTPNPFTDTFASAGFTQSFGPPGAVHDINLGLGSGFGSSGFGLGVGQTSLNMNMNLNPNSPEGFRANLQLALSYLGDVVRLAQAGRNGIEKAYNADARPVDLIACLSNLNHTLESLWTILRHSGIGALPIVPPPSLTNPSLTLPPSDPTSTPGGDSKSQTSQTNAPNLPNSASDAVNASEKATQQLYERLKRVQGNHGVVASILGADVRR